MRSPRTDAKIREKKRKIISHRDNAPAHKTALTVGKLRDLKYNSLDYLLLAISRIGTHRFPYVPKLEEISLWEALRVQRKS